MSRSGEPAFELLLAGDIGGTKSNVGLFRHDGGPPALVRGAQLASDDYPGLGALVADFLARSSPGEAAGIRAACFGVPGPVAGDRAETTNLAWEIDCRRVAGETGIPEVRLVNDLVATAESLPLLGERDMAVLHPGAPGAAGNRALIAAGTGLGMALLPRLPGRAEAHLPVASEGGHMDYAPRTAEEVALFGHLAGRFGRVSVERVVSGPGLANVHGFLLASGRECREAREGLLGEDPAPAITEAALAGTCATCARALDLFVAGYGAAAGNLALLGTATGGVYLGGGIAPKILPKLAGGTFVEAFLAKGRFRPYMEAVPVRVILEERAAMFGAARIALALLAR